MNRRVQGSSSGAELNDAHDALRLVSGRLDEKEGFPSFTEGHADEPEKKQVVDAGLKSMDHCMRSPTNSVLVVLWLLVIYALRIMSARGVFRLPP